jgi:hypothetical protein
LPRTAGSFAAQPFPSRRRSQQGGRQDEKEFPMKARTAIVTALALLALTAPAAQAQIPWEPGMSGKWHVMVVNQHKLDPKVRHTGCPYIPYAYVPGGSSAKVAQAIVDAAERMGCRQPLRVTPPSKGADRIGP